MIKFKNGTAAISLASVFTQKGLTVSAKPNTVLGEMVRLTNLPQGNAAMVTDATDNDTMTAYMLENASSGTLDAKSDHDLFVDSVVSDIAKAVLAHVSYAKNEVKAAVLEVASVVEEQLANLVAPSASDNIHITVRDLPELVQDISFMDDIGRYEGKNPLTPSVVLDFGAKAHSDILALALTGNQETDEHIAAWHNHLPEGVMEGLWNGYFTKTQGNALQTAESNDPFERLDKGICLYLLGRRLFADVSQNNTQVTLAQYKQAMAEVRDFGACLIQSAMKRFASFKTTQQIVTSVMPDQCGCTVFGENYRQWLTAGGSPEALFGMVVSGQNIMFRSALDAAKEKLVANWNSHSAFYATDANNKRFASFKSIVGLAFRSTLNSMGDQEKVYVESHPQHAAMVEKLLTKELDGLRAKDMNDLHDVALRVVCRARFYYTSAEKILGDIQQVAKGNPNMNVREAALIAVINYVADYVAEQMTLAV